MEMMVDFLVHNYMWFLVTTIILILALIGYLVEEKEYKKASQFGNFSQDIEKNFERLAMQAQNQTIGNAIMNQGVGQVNPMSMNQNQGFVNQGMGQMNPQNSMNMPMQNSMSNQVTQNNSSFQVLQK